MKLKWLMKEKSKDKQTEYCLLMVSNVRFVFFVGVILFAFFIKKYYSIIKISSL